MKICTGIITLILATFFFASSSIAQKSDAKIDNIFGIKLGMIKAEAEAILKSQNYKYSLTQGSLVISKREDVKFDGFQADNIFFLFDDNGSLEQVNINFPGYSDDHNLENEKIMPALKELYTKRYGKPEEDFYEGYWNTKISDGTKISIALKLSISAECRELRAWIKIRREK